MVDDAIKGLRLDGPVPNVANLKRSANRAREALRPKHPKNLDFEVLRDFMLLRQSILFSSLLQFILHNSIFKPIECYLLIGVSKNNIPMLTYTAFSLQLDLSHFPDDFLQSDVHHDGQRHLVMMSDLQKTYLSRAKTWYIDGTFKAARKPFIQLFSIHVFICSEKVMKQVPVCFVLMSRRKKTDYKAVLEAILDVLPEAPAVEEAVLDFERAIWAALGTVLPGVKPHGCWFHWSQAVYRKVCILSKFMILFKFRNIGKIFGIWNCTG